MLKFRNAHLRKGVGIALTGLVLASVSACGEDEPLTKSTATGTPIKIGVVVSLSNKPLPATAAPEGLKAWAATVNGKGGLAGHPVEIVVRDDGNDPAKSLTAVKQLVEDDEVVAITSWTSVDTSWAEYIQGKNIPVVGGQSYSPVWYENPAFFPVQSTLGTAMTSQPLMAKNAGAGDHRLLLLRRRRHRGRGGQGEGRHRELPGPEGDLQRRDQLEPAGLHRALPGREEGRRRRHDALRSPGRADHAQLRPAGLHPDVDPAGGERDRGGAEDPAAR